MLPVTINPLPEISKLPVITAEPENGKPEPPAFKAKDAVVANDALKMLLEPYGPKTLDAVTKDAVLALPINVAISVDLFSHLAAVES